MLEGMALRALQVDEPLARVARMALATFKDLCLDAADARSGSAPSGPVRSGSSCAAGEDRTATSCWSARRRSTRCGSTRCRSRRRSSTAMHLDVNVGSVDELTRLGATVVDADTSGGR